MPSTREAQRAGSAEAAQPTPALPDPAVNLSKLALLSSAAWRTAQSTEASRRMDYAWMLQISQTYELQAMYQDAQSATIDALVTHGCRVRGRCSAASACSRRSGRRSGTTTPTSCRRAASRQSPWLANSRVLPSGADQQHRVRRRRARRHLHARRPHRHARRGDAAGGRVLAQQPLHVVRRHEAFDEIPVDLRGVARRLAGRHADLLSKRLDIVRLHHVDREAGRFHVRHPSRRSSRSSGIPRPARPAEFPTARFLVLLESSRTCSKKRLVVCAGSVT